MKHKQIMASWQTELVLEEEGKIVSSTVMEDGALKKIFAYTGRHVRDPIELDFQRSILVGYDLIKMPVFSATGAPLRRTNISREDLYLIVERFEWAIALESRVSKFCNFVEKRKEAATSAVLEA